MLIQNKAVVSQDLKYYQMMNSIFAISQYFQDRDPGELLLIFGIFFAICAFITLICWVFFSGGNTNHSSLSDRRSRQHNDRNTVERTQISNSNSISKTTSDLNDYDQQQQRSINSLNQAQVSKSSSSTNISYHSEHEIETLTRVEAEKYFSTELSSSYARWDDEFGIIYIVPPMPDQTDDLTKIRGISKAYERELHRIGIFMYKQIASWPNETCHHISHELHSNDLIFRENWPAQARELHFHKYQEQV